MSICISHLSKILAASGAPTDVVETFTRQIKILLDDRRHLLVAAANYRNLKATIFRRCLKFSFVMEPPAAPDRL